MSLYYIFILYSCYRLKYYVFNTPHNITYQKLPMDRRVEVSQVILEDPVQTGMQERN